MIEKNPPDTWQDLEEAVARILEESSLRVERKRVIETVRGNVEIDVFATDEHHAPPITYLCECKHWKTRVPQNVVHSFRTVVADFGANYGLLISSVGFQDGAFEAAKNTNIRLLSWNEFQEMFAHRWFSNYMAPLIEKEANRLVSYTEPINAGIFRKADALPKDQQQAFIQLRGKYQDIAFLALSIYRFWVGLGEDRFPTLPLLSRNNGGLDIGENLPEELMRATSLREFLEILLTHVHSGLKEFDEMFH